MNCWGIFHGVSRAWFFAFLRFCYYPYLKKISKWSVKNENFRFCQIFFAFVLGIIAIWSFFCGFVLLQRVNVRHFFVFRHNPYLKKWRNFSEKKWKFSNIDHFFKVCVLGLTCATDLFGQLFIEFTRFIFLRHLVICHYPYLNKIVENSVKIWNL